ncbi:MAG: serine hydrolase domain-containing protein [Cytophagales bacterium]|nr:serine hydrolase domain-containing protein [Cytophagales bacterium]
MITFKYSLLLIIINVSTHSLWSQSPRYSAAIEAKIHRVEDSLIYHGNTYLNAPRYSLADCMRKEGVPGVNVAVIKNFALEWVRSWGLADARSGRPLTPQTLMKTGSVNKSINAFAFLKLMQDGVIDFDQDINEIMREWQFPYTRNKPISTYHLLSHTSGLWFHPVSTYDHGPFKPNLVKFLNRKKSPQDKSKPYLHTLWDPGLKYQYSNLGYSVSQQVLIESTGSDYESFIKQAILDPLNMVYSLYTIDKKQHNFASGHWNGGKRVPGKFRPQVEFGPGGLWTTPEDLAKYVIELQLSYQGISNKVLTKESTDFIFTPIQQELPHSSILNQGLGSFLVNKKGGRKYFFHAGLSTGYTAMFIGSVEGGNGAVVLTNGPSESLVYAIVARIAEVYEWPDYLIDEARISGPIDRTPKELAPFLGKFRCQEHPENEVEISLWEDKQLVMNFTGGEYAHPILAPLDEPHTFWAESFSLYSFTKLMFSREINAKMNQFQLSNAEKTTNWERVKMESLINEQP